MSAYFGPMSDSAALRSELTALSVSRIYSSSWTVTTRSSTSVSGKHADVMFSIICPLSSRSFCKVSKSSLVLSIFSEISSRNSWFYEEAPEPLIGLNISSFLTWSSTVSICLASYCANLVYCFSALDRTLLQSSIIFSLLLYFFISSSSI